MRSWLKENWFKLTIAIVAVLAFITYAGHKDRERREELTRQRELDYCLQSANHTYDTKWNLGCKNQGQENCQLSIAAIDLLNENLEKEKEFCLKRYPQN